MKKTLLSTISIVCRIIAIGLAAIVLVLSFTSASSLSISSFVDGITSMLPQSLSGLFVIPTPFGGAFRGDLAIASLIFFIADYLCFRFAKKASEA